MKKILIVSWIDGQNYGTLLQIYCFQEVLKNMNKFINYNGSAFSFDVKVLNYSKTYTNSFKSGFGNFSQRIGKIARRGIKKNIIKIIEIYKLKKIFRKMSIREKRFNEYRAKNLQMYPDNLITQIDDLKKITNFDIYIIGSDQVWNPKMLDEVYLLNWVPNNKTKISYAPSLCVNNLTNEELIKYKELAYFKSISVREYTNATNQISKLTKKKIVQVVDPVILYGRESLLNFCKYEDANYCLTYFLGDDKLSRKYAIKFSSKNNLQIKSIIAVNTMHMKNDYALFNFAVWDVNPLELINLIYNAKVVITDSFHVLVIATLLHKDFIILERENTDSQQNNRLITFLKNINLDYKLNKKFDTVDEIKIDDETWKAIDEKIEDLRLKSFEFLVDALK